MAISTVVFSDPFFGEMDRAMNRLMNSALAGGSLATSGPVATSGSSRAGGLPGRSLAIDIIETPTAYEMHADVPGMSPEDVKVELHEGVLTVSGERKVSYTPGEAGSKVWRSERGSYSFSRAFTLPENANANSISATMEQGVLTVKVTKKDPPAKPEPKRITVTAA